MRSVLRSLRCRVIFSPEWIGFRSHWNPEAIEEAAGLFTLHQRKALVKISKTFLRSLACWVLFPRNLNSATAVQCELFGDCLVQQSFDLLFAGLSDKTASFLTALNQHHSWPARNIAAAYPNGATGFTPKFANQCWTEKRPGSAPTRSWWLFAY